MLTMLCVDSDVQRLAQIKQDLQPLDSSIKLVEATSLKDALHLILHKKKNLRLYSQHNTFAMVMPSRYLDILNSNLFAK